jgi:hypothetical protein
MGKAIYYALEQWESLEVYLQDPLIEIDTSFPRLRWEKKVLLRRTAWFMIAGVVWAYPIIFLKPYFGHQCAVFVPQFG